ncbi:hypothetical protein vseg_017135 [Gypsophila vaccaria]
MLNTNNQGKANYLAQSNALLRKNLVYQRRNKCQNCCLFVTPVFILIILVVLQTYIEHQLRDKTKPPPIPEPPALPVELLLSSVGFDAVRSHNISSPDLLDVSCKNSSACHATFLATGANQSFGLGLVRDLFPTVSSKDSSDLLAQAVLGSYSVGIQRSSDTDTDTYTDTDLDFYLQTSCNKSSSISNDSEFNCMQGLTLWRNSSVEINDEIFKSKTAHISVGARSEFTGAFDFLNSDGRNFNVTLLYDDHDYTSPTWILRLANMVTNAYLQYSNGTGPMILVDFIKDMPTHNYLSTPNIVALMSTLFFIWIVVWLFPVMLQALVYEKQHNLRMMMKMHGLGDGAYWSISYGYFAIVSYIYMLCFVIFGSLLGLGFFITNDYMIQFVFYFIYVNLQVSMAFLAASLFSNVKTASVVGYLLVFVTGLLGNFLFKSLLETSSFPRKWVIVLELFPGFALFRGLYELQLYAFEASVSTGTGMQWQDLGNPGNGMKEVIIIMFVEWLVSLLLAYYVDRVSFSGCWFKKPSPLQRSGSRLSSEAEKADVIQEREIVEQLKLASPAGYAIVCDDIRKVYPTRDGNPPKVAVKGMSLALPQTGCFGMLGPNGAGKTSFISMMIGLTKPTSGKVLINGLDIETHMHEIYSTMGVCPQHDLLWGTLTGREHLLFYGRLKNLSGAALNEAVEESLKNLNLFYGGVADKQAGKYSGGMKRRLSVAISLIGNPQVVFMDEPSTGLDPASRNNLWNVVKRAKQDRAIILTTHSMEEAEALCDRLGIFVDGSLQCIADAKELKARYGGSFVLTITTTAEHDLDVEAIVYQLTPNAQRIYHLSGTQKFELPKHEVRIADVFEAVEIAKSRFPVHAWGLADTTLEDVFIKVARDAQPYAHLS